MTPYEELLEDLAAEHRRSTRCWRHDRRAVGSAEPCARLARARSGRAPRALRRGGGARHHRCGGLPGGCRGRARGRGPRRLRKAVPRPGPRDDTRRAAGLVARGRRDAPRRRAHGRAEGAAALVWPGDGRGLVRHGAAHGDVVAWARCRRRRRHRASRHGPAAARGVPRGADARRSPTSRAASRRTRRPCMSSSRRRRARPGPMASPGPTTASRAARATSAAS